ncbi:MULTISPECIES: VanZ family protein [unclassified Streptomyces]|uniref:VanZ family protein n=1 Tax=unclassified Streptomyces TaxID=2593676 RepID=UPI003792902F
MLVRGAVLTVVLLGLVVFSVLLAKVTLTPSPASEDLVTSNLRPGRSLRQYAEDYTFLAACKQAGGNLLLGVPFGLLLPFFVPRRLRMIRTTLLTAGAMVIVELIQGALVAGRAFDIDDVILNTTGALLGYFVLGRRISHRYYTYADAPGPAERPDEPKAEQQRTPRPAGRTKTAGAKAAAAKTAGAKTAGTKPAATKPARTKAAGTKTAATKPARTKTAATKAARTKAAATKAAGTKTARTKSARTGTAAAKAAPTKAGRSLLDRFRRR